MNLIGNKARLYVQSERVQQGIVLWLLGFVGILTLLLVPLPPLPDDVVLPFSPLVVKLLNLIFPTILMTLAVIAGARLAPRVGLGAPLLLSVVRGTSRFALLRRQFAAGMVGGLLGGLILVAAHYWQPDVLKAVQDELPSPPLIVGVLYGGITEEVLLRWGLMTVLVWGSIRLFYRSSSGVPATPYVVAIIVTAFFFGAGHLPALYAFVTDVTPPLIMYIVGLNAVFGVVAGYLYWKHGLEAAFVAHGTAHLFGYAPSLL